MNSDLNGNKYETFENGFLDKKSSFPSSVSFSYFSPAGFVDYNLQCAGYGLRKSSDKSHNDSDVETFDNNGL